MAKEVAGSLALSHGLALAAVGLYAAPAAATVVQSNTEAPTPTTVSLLGYSIDVSDQSSALTKVRFTFPAGVTASTVTVQPGNAVDPSLNWNVIWPDFFQPFVTNGDTYYAAFRFDAGGGDVNYGFIETDGATKVLGYAYESDVNTAITVYDVTAAPEPASLALLASGMVGVAALRRRSAVRPAH